MTPPPVQRTRPYNCPPCLESVWVLARFRHHPSHANEPHRHKRVPAVNSRLGLWSATALVVASMIGTGVFTTSGFLLADLGSRWLVVAAWLVGGVIAMLGASCYGALARRIPESGGEYLFLSRTLHPAAGYLAGWVSLLAGFSAPLAAAALGFGEYARAWLGQTSPAAIGTALILLVTAAHAWRLRLGTITQNLAVAAKIAFLGAFLLLGAFQLRGAETFSDLAPASALSAFAVSLVWISFSYSGWNAAIYLSSEIRDPERNVPRALLLGTAAVTLLYVALNALIVFAAPPAALAGQLDVARVAARHLGGAPWAHAITALVTLALATSVSSLTMVGPRVCAKMAADGCLPRWLRTTRETPTAAILFQSTLAIALLWTASFKALLTCIGFILSLSTAATVLGLIRLRRREGPALRVPGWPWAPALFIAFVLFTTAFTIHRQPRESLIGLATLAVGLAAWRLSENARRRKSTQPG